MAIPGVGCCTSAEGILHKHSRFGGIHTLVHGAPINVFALIVGAKIIRLNKPLLIMFLQKAQKIALRELCDEIKTRDLSVNIDDPDGVYLLGITVAGWAVRFRSLARPFLSHESIARLEMIEAADIAGNLASTHVARMEIESLIPLVEDLLNENAAVVLTTPARLRKNNNPKLSHPTDKEGVNLASDRVFLAMWYHESTENVWKKGIKPAIEELGYEPVLVKEQQFVGLIVNQIISEIRKARFVVVDYTHRRPGVLGSVYCEAGYADGMGLEVISTCEKTILKKVHFDTQQHNHIVWEAGEEDELKSKLKNRIIELMGDGPSNKSTN